MSPPPHYLKTPSSISFTISASSTYPPLPLPRFKFKPWFHTSWPSSTYTYHFNHQDLTFLTSPFNFLWQSSTPVTPHVYIFIQFEYLEPTAQALLKAVSASIFFHRLVPWKSFTQSPSQDKFVVCTTLKLFMWSTIISEPSLAILQVTAPAADSPSPSLSSL